MFSEMMRSTKTMGLKQFNDEFDQWIIDVFKGIGCDTAKSVLKLSREELIQRTDLEEETVDGDSFG